MEDHVDQTIFSWKVVIKMKIIYMYVCVYLHRYVYVFIPVCVNEFIKRKTKVTESLQKLLLLF